METVQDELHLANIALDYIGNLKTIINAINKLVEHEQPQSVKDLSQLAANLSDDYYGLIDLRREELEQSEAALIGGES